MVRGNRAADLVYRGPIAFDISCGVIPANCDVAGIHCGKMPRQTIDIVAGHGQAPFGDGVEHRSALGECALKFGGAVRCYANAEAS